MSKRRLVTTHVAKYEFNGSFYTEKELNRMAQEQVHKGEKADMAIVKEFAKYHPYYGKYEEAEYTCRKNMRDGEYSFLIIVDGEEIPISYHTCIEGITGKRKRFSEYFRYVVRDQIREWKKKNQKPCEKCKRIGQGTADHKKAFESLVKAFCKEYYPDMNPEKIWEISEEDYKQMMDKFRKYHKEHAVLQNLCDECNRRKGHRSE